MKIGRSVLLRSVLAAEFKAAYPHGMGESFKINFRGIGADNHSPDKPSGKIVSKPVLSLQIIVSHHFCDDFGSVG